MLPDTGYAAAPVSGDSAGILTYSGIRTGAFAATTTTPLMTGGETFGAFHDDAGKAVNAVVGHPPSSTVAPSITGTLAQGHTVSTSNGTWGFSPTSFTYAWQRCTASGTSCSDIAGATSATYLLSAADVGHRVRAVVTAASPFGSTNASSAASGVIAPPPPPVMSGVSLKSLRSAPRQERHCG
jgi:hypothetical protein